MTINEARAMNRVAVINKLLESRYGLRVELGSADHLAEVKSHYNAKRDNLLLSLGETDALVHPDYAKAVLISEAAMMILREIAPKRMKRKKTKTKA